jgi:hypothetical protein
VGRTSSFARVPVDVTLLSLFRNQGPFVSINPKTGRVKTADHDPNLMIRFAPDGQRMPAHYSAGNFGISWYAPDAMYGVQLEFRGPVDLAGAPAIFYLINPGKPSTITLAANSPTIPWRIVAQEAIGTKSVIANIPPKLASYPTEIAWVGTTPVMKMSDPESGDTVTFAVPRNINATQSEVDVRLQCRHYQAHTVSAVCEGREIASVLPKEIGFSRRDGDMEPYYFSCDAGAIDGFLLKYRNYKWKFYKNVKIPP